MKNRKVTTAHLLALATVIIWGTTFISTKILLRDFTPVEILFFRFTLGYVALLMIYPHILKPQSWRQELLFAAAGLCGVTLYFLLENIALTYTLASNAGIIVYIAPIFTALLAHRLLDGERLQPCFFVGFGAAMNGISVVVLNGNYVLNLNPLGDFLATLAAVVLAVYSVLMKKISAFQYHIIHCTRKVFLYGLFFMLPALFFSDFHWQMERLAAPANWFNILFLGFGASALCFVTWNWSVGVLGAVTTSAYIYLVPVITMVTSAWVLQEPLTGMALLGAGLTLLGLFLSQHKSDVKVKAENNVAFDR